MSELATGGLKTGEDRTKFDARDATQKELKERIDRMERAAATSEELRATGRPPAAQPGVDGAEIPEDDYRAAYRSYLKFGFDSKPHFKIRGVSQGDRIILSKRAQKVELTREELDRELRVVSGGSGIVSGGQGAYPGATSGFFVPVGFVNEIEQAMKYYGPMLDGGAGMPTIMPTDSGQLLPFPVSNDTK